MYTASPVCWREWPSFDCFWMRGTVPVREGVICVIDNC